MQQVVYYKKIIFKITILLFSFFVSLVLIEVALILIQYPYQGCEQVLDAAETSIGKFNSQTGWSYKPSISYYGIAKNVNYHFNEEAIRFEKPKREVDFSKPRIIFIGGSVAFGDHINFEDTYANQINEMLDNRFEVINLGVQGFGTDQSLEILRNYIDWLKPSYVVYTFIPDHIDRNINYDRRQHLKCYYFSGTKPVFSIRQGELVQIENPQKYILEDRFKTLLFLRSNYRLFREKKWDRSGFALEITQKLIQEIDNLSKNYGAKALYIYYDTAYGESEQNWNKFIMDKIFEKGKMERVLNFTNWAYDSQPAGTKYYVSDTDDIHPNSTLSAEIAKKFVEKFEEEFR